MATSQAAHPEARTSATTCNGRLGLAGGVGALLLLSACGGGGGKGGASTGTGSGVVRVHYTLTGHSEGTTSHTEIDSILDLTHGRSRTTYVSSDDHSVVGSWFVWDGSALLTHMPGNPPQYTRTEKANLEPGMTQGFDLRPGTAAFTAACPGGRRSGTQMILNRSAVRYSCKKNESQHISRAAHEMALDQATGFLLSDIGTDFTMVATKITLNPPVTTGTFSTKVPTGGEDSAHPTFTDFRLPAIGGGELALADHRNQPLVIITGDAAGIRQMAKRLLPMTARGSKPQLLGLLFAIPSKDWKGSLLKSGDAKSFIASVSKAAGTFNIPVGIDIKGNAGGQITTTAGFQPGVTSFPWPPVVGLLRTDGSIDGVFIGPKTSDAQLRAAIAHLS